MNGVKPAIDVPEKRDVEVTSKNLSLFPPRPAGFMGFGRPTLPEGGYYHPGGVGHVRHYSRPTRREGIITLPLGGSASQGRGGIFG
jgi:hypothetical protein